MRLESEKPVVNLREKNRERTRREIAQCALALFREKGFENVPVEEICERAGVSRATFFNYFPQKELVFSMVAESRLRFIREFLASQRAPAQNFAGVIDLFMRLAEVNEQEEEQVKFTIQQVLQRPACRELALATRKEFEVALSDMLRAIRKQGGALNSSFKITDIVELLLSIYFATLLEWAGLPDTPKGWLVKKMRVRIKLAAQGILAAGEEADNV